jgi:NAD(P)-dependent dehydrogenase (short-subunit alcohol dehydrogenase family)
MSLTADTHAQPVAIVTGAGSGIGRATALALAAAGMSVLGVGRRQSALRSTTDVDSRIEVMSADLGDIEAPQRVIGHAADLWGRIDLIVNNAGGTIRGRLEEVEPSHISDLIALHVIAPTLMTRAALPWLRQTRGSVVNVSSTFGHRPSPGSGHYGAAKAALEHLTRTWALELAPDRIRVNAVAPGPTETEVLTASGLTVEEAQTLKAAQTARIPLGRRGTAEDIAHWIVALAGPDASWVTGQVLTIDGGLELL